MYEVVLRCALENRNPIAALEYAKYIRLYSNLDKYLINFILLLSLFCNLQLLQL